eukprot:TRINITY_DN2152_c0_g3_i2.p1 TRINITY_DN2152_c0_g3~~TRINITY_DN2152_c0_g3_i2.p1  ORF type:complete len:347 (+),score=26.60 TRINITY_DN2152_c0_g3_i2:939-1979(+)
MSECNRRCTVLQLRIKQLFLQNWSISWGKLNDPFMVGISVLLILILISVWWAVYLPCAWWDSYFGSANIVFGQALFCFIFMNFLLTNQVSPGRIPAGWIPAFATEDEMNAAKATAKKEFQKKRLVKAKRKFVWGPQTVRYCWICKNFKPPRTHHCKECQTCTLKMDHHCPWVNNCIGVRNHKFYVNFLCSAWIGLAYAMIVFGYRLIAILLEHGDEYYHDDSVVVESGTVEASGGVADDDLGKYTFVHVFLIVANLLLIIPILSSLYCLLSYQVRLIMDNVTTIEEFERRAMERKTPRFKWYFDLGKLNNVKQVMGDKPILWFLPTQRRLCDGLSWPTGDNAKQEV